MSSLRPIDVAIIGGGPAGLQAALVLARTGKKVVVIDDPKPPRNAASHGVHNFVGLDGMRPTEIRDQAWKQIDHYGTVGHSRAAATRITRAAESQDLVVETDDGAWQARHVVLACGYEDRHPPIDGFAACWADSIIPCPFCDGYENRGRRWGIVATGSHELDVFPAMTRNWTDQRVVIVPAGLTVTDTQRDLLDRLGVPLHVGDIVAIDHDNGKVRNVTLDDGTDIEVGTLLWTPPEAPTALVTALVDELGLELDGNGYVAADGEQRTNVDGLWAAGDVQGWMGAIESANAGGMAAAMIVHGWYQPTARWAA